MKSLFGFVLLFLSICCFAQPNSTYPQLPYTEFKSVDIIDDYIIARGSCDQLWFSADGGDSWQIDEILDQNLANVALIQDDPSKAVIILREEVVIYDLNQKEIVNSSADGSLELRWGNKVMTQGSEIYLLTNDGLFRSTLDVYDWELIFERPADSGSLNVADLTDDYIFIGTNDGKIYRFDIALMNTALRSDFDMKINELTMGTNDIGYIVGGASSSVQKTTDGCTSFEVSSALVINRNIHAHGPDKVATILGLRMDISLDGGQTAENYLMSNTAYFGDIDDGFIANDGTIYAYGKGSTIAKTTDNGETFEFISPYNRSDFYDVNIYDDGFGLSCGEFSTVIATLDYGHSWAPIDLGLPENETFLAIDRLSNGQIIVGGYEGIHIVEDNQVIHTEGVNCNDILITNSGNLLAHVNNEGVYQVIRSADNGMTWEVVQDAVSYTAHIRQGKDGRIYLPTQSQEIYLSDDDGVTWIIGDLGLTFNNVYPYDENILMGTVNNELYRSEDGGVTWNSIYSAYLIDNLIFISASTCYFTYAQNGETRLMFSDDAGINWEEKYQNCSRSYATALTKEEEVVMAQSTGHINIYPSNITSTKEDKMDFTKHFRIWPNPLDRNTPLQINEDWNEVQIINLEGRVVMSYKTQKSELDLSRLDRGMYIVQANHNGIIKSEKLIIF